MVRAPIFGLQGKVRPEQGRMHSLAWQLTEAESDGLACFKPCSPGALAVSQVLRQLCVVAVAVIIADGSKLLSL